MPHTASSTDAEPKQPDSALGQWVYCRSHVGAHSTGWCSVSAHNKIALEATCREEADEEVKALGLPCFGYCHVCYKHIANTHPSGQTCPEHDPAVLAPSDPGAVRTIWTAPRSGKGSITLEDTFTEQWVAEHPRDWVGEVLRYAQYAHARDRMFRVRRTTISGIRDLVSTPPSLSRTLDEDGGLLPFPATTAEPTEPDARWFQLVRGLRVRAFLRSGVLSGEITGMDVEKSVVWVVADGEEQPRRFHWSDVRPA